MKKLSFVFLLFLSFSSYSQNAVDDFQKSDKALNSIYQDILKKYSNDPVFISSMKISQNAWISFRDAQLLMKFPHTEHNYYGSVSVMCKNSYLSELTNERVKQLSVWLEGVKEGDVCSGSIMYKK